MIYTEGFSTTQPTTCPTTMPFFSDPVLQLRIEVTELELKVIRQQIAIELLNKIIELHLKQHKEPSKIFDMEIKKQKI